ncbi:hypothetical protein BH11ACT6_BH11ACT6_34800 [soil metagenome]
MPADTDDQPRKAPPPPAILVRHGRADGPGRQLWKQYVGHGETVPYVLDPGELRVLRDACVMADRMEKLEKAAGDDERITVRGSQGQPVINPTLAEARQLALAIAQLLSKIKLPEGESSGSETGSNPRSVGARAAANARWDKA